jgi:MoxR-like ATPase
VLLIDELDKVDSAFEALLLEVLSAWQLSIPKLGTIKARTIPFVVLTSNEERRIGDPLRRRSFYVRFDYPSTEREIQILSCRASNCGLEIRRHTAAFARALRTLSLSKPPSISEILEMAQVMELLGIAKVAPGLQNVLLPILVKTESDRRLLMIDDQWESLIYDATKFQEEMLVVEKE